MTKNACIVNSLACLMVKIKPANEFNVINNEFQKWIKETDLHIFREEKVDKKIGYLSMYIYEQDAAKITDWFEERGIDVHFSDD